MVETSDKQLERVDDSHQEVKPTLGQIGWRENLVDDERDEALKYWRQKFDYLYENYQDLFPQEYQEIWPVIQEFDDLHFVKTLILGLQTLDQDPVILAKLPHLDPEVTQQFIEFKKMMVDALLAQTIAQDKPPVTQDRINTLLGLLRESHFLLGNDEDALEENEKTYLAHSKQELEEFKKFREDSIEYAKAHNIDSIMSLLDTDSRKTLPDEFRIALEDLFFDGYGSTDLSDNSAYIVSKVNHDKGWITGSYEDEQTFMDEFFGANHKVENDQYIDFLWLISQALKKNQVTEGTLHYGIFTVSVGGREYLISGKGAVRHYDQPNPFTGSYPEQEPNDIVIYGGSQVDPSQRLVLIPSTWQVLADKYHFYEVNSFFSFGPATLLPKILGHVEPAQRYDEFEKLFEDLKKLAAIE